MSHSAERLSQQSQSYKFVHMTYAVPVPSYILWKFTEELQDHDRRNRGGSCQMKSSRPAHISFYKSNQFIHIIELFDSSDIHVLEVIQIGQCRRPFCWQEGSLCVQLNIVFWDKLPFAVWINGTRLPVPSLRFNRVTFLESTQPILLHIVLFLYVQHYIFLFAWSYTISQISLAWGRTFDLEHN